MRDETEEDSTALTAPTASDLYEQGRRQIAHAQYESAYTALRQSVALDPARGWVWLHLGIACTWLHRFDEAEAAFAQAIVLAGEDACGLGWAYYYRGHLQQSRGDLEQAIADYRQSASQGDDFFYGSGDASEVYLHLARIYEQLGDYRNAISSYKDFGFYGKAYVTVHEVKRLTALLDAQR